MTLAPEHERCATCRHQDLRAFAVPICTRAGMPQACVLAWERECQGRKFEARA